jgi:trk system potassium uptake protein TrkA
VGETDLFIAMTSDDEDNILASMLAKRMGARRVIALVNRRAYAEMLQGSAIDIAISPAQAVIGELLLHVRRGAVAAVHSLRRGMAEALEGIARGDARTSHLVGRRIEQLKLPAGARGRHRARRGRAGPHPGAAPRHGDRDRRPRDHLPAEQAPGARGGEAV